MSSNAFSDNEEEDFEEDSRHVVDSTQVSWERKKGGRGIYILDIKLYDDYDYGALCKDISASLKCQHYSTSSSTPKETKVGSLDGHLLSNNNIFFETADAKSGELITLARLFCNSCGKLTRGRFAESSTETTRTGLKNMGVELLHIKNIRILKEHKGQDLGLRVIHELMVFLRGRWNVCLMEVGFGHNKDRLDMTVEDEVARYDQAKLKLSRHYARMGFQQVGRNSEESNYWFMTSSFYFAESSSTANLTTTAATTASREWISKEESQNIDVFLPAKPHRSIGADKKLQDLMHQVLRSKERDPSLQEQKLQPITEKIQTLIINERASIHESRALFVLAANPEHNLSPLVRSVFQYLLSHPTADVNTPDETGNRPLHIAAAQMNFTEIQLLIQAGGASILTVTNDKGETPWQTLVAARQNQRDSNDVFSLQSNMREIEPFLKSMPVLLPQNISTLLIDGYISPRMRMMLSITAETNSDILRDHDCTDMFFEHRRRPMPLSQCCARYDGMTRVDYIPTAVFLQNEEGVYQSFAEGWQIVWRAIFDVLQMNQAPTATNVLDEITEMLEMSHNRAERGEKLRQWQHFVRKGGRIEYALDCLFSVTRNVLFYGEDGWGYDDYEDEIEQLPQTPLDDDFDLVRCKCLGITHENMNEQPNGPYNHGFD